MNIFTINNLPKKSDFTINSQTILETIKRNYLEEYNNWEKDIIKERYIRIKTEVNENLLSNSHITSIKSLFINLGFDEKDIEISSYTDTKNIFIRLKIYE